MIIGFCGRMRSGKTELAKICESYGYKKLYFALPLKQLCASIIDISIDELNRLKADNTDLSLYIGKDICDILSTETEIPYGEVASCCFGKTIHTIREMLQFIGTDLIRKYNEDWHVNRIRAMIREGVNYVIDDVRFPNEKKMIEDFGGDCWFVTRTTFENISNHESETSIKWNECWNKVIINDSTLPKLLFKWEVFMDNYEQSKITRDREFERVLNNGTDEICPLSLLDVMLLPKALFTYTPKVIDKKEIEKVEMNDDNVVFITYKNGTIEVIENPLNIEDLKILL